MHSWPGRDYQFYVAVNEQLAEEGPYYFDGRGALLVQHGVVYVTMAGEDHGYNVYPGEAVQWCGAVSVDHAEGAQHATFAVAGVPEGKDWRWLYRATVQRHNKPWGHELDVRVDDNRFMLKYLQTEPGHRTSLQVHDHKDECQFFIDEPGRGFVHIPPATEHRVGSHVLHRYFEASTYYPDDVIRLEDDYQR